MTGRGGQGGWPDPGARRRPAPSATAYRSSAEPLVAWMAADPERAGLCLDFDGTLAPIVEDPAAVRLDASLRPVLRDLAARLGTVAVVSGRPAAFLGARAAVEGVRLLGLYGLEEWRDGAAVPRAEAARWQGEVDRARALVQAQVGGLAGVLVEDKGLSVAVHWRRASDRAAAQRAVGEVTSRVAAVTGLAVEPGKLVAELRPPVAWDKGSAVRALAEDRGLDRVAYLGDDLGDLPAFAAVAALGGCAVAVDHGAETPPALLASADVILAGPPAVRAFLSSLRAALAAAPGSP